MAMNYKTDFKNERNSAFLTGHMWLSNYTAMWRYALMVMCRILGTYDIINVDKEMLTGTLMSRYGLERFRYELDMCFRLHLILTIESAVT